MERTPHNPVGPAARLTRELHPARLLPAVTAAAVIALLQVFLAVSFAALVFAGELTPFLARGVGFALFGAVVLGGVLSLFASLPGTVGGVQSIPSAVLAVIGAEVVAALGPDAPLLDCFVTLVAAIGVSGAVAGLLLLALGRFRLGDLVRFLPHPVLGGFLAGTGWLLVVGAVGLMAGTDAPLGDLAALLEPGVLARWLPGVAVALLLLAAARTGRVLALPGMVLGACGLVHLGAWLAGASVATLGAQGWLLGPFPQGAMWQPLSWAEMQAVDGAVLLAQLPTVATVALVTTLALLLNAGGLEASTGRELDLNRELRVAGFANLAAGAGGGLVGFQQVSVSLLGLALAGPRRLVGVLAAVLTGAVLVWGASFLALFPTPVLGGLLLFLGLGLLKEWAVDARARLPRREHAVVLGILGVIATTGLLPGVGVGLVAAVLLFTLEYGRTEVVWRERSGAHLWSRVGRSAAEREVLRRHADALRVYELQGFLFFGSAARLLPRVEAWLAGDNGRPRRLLFDFRRVSGVDATAAAALWTLQRRATLRGVAVGFVGMPPAVAARLAAGDATPAGGVEVFADLDRALEHHETALFASHPPAETPGDALAALLPDPELRCALLPFLERRALAPGGLLVAQGEPADELFLVASGALTARLERPGAPPLRLESVGAGHLLGELGFFLREPRSASVVADAPSVVWVLSRAAFARLGREQPAAALALQRLLVQLLSGRVRHLMGVVQALED